MTSTATKIPKLPKPETTRAFLRSDGYIRETITAHIYVETRLVDLPGPGDGQAYEFVYECFKTGARRRWGTRYVNETDAPDLTPDPSMEPN